MAAAFLSTHFLSIHFSRLVFIIHFSRASPGITRMQTHAQTHTHKKKQELCPLCRESPGRHLHMASAGQTPIEGGGEVSSTLLLLLG